MLCGLIRTALRIKKEYDKYFVEHDCIEDACMYARFKPKNEWKECSWSKCGYLNVDFPKKCPIWRKEWID